MDTARSIWKQLKQELEQDVAANPLRQLSRLVQGAAIAVANPQDPKFDANFIDAGFFYVSAVDSDGRELVTAEELAEAVGLALEFAHGEFNEISWARFQEGPSYIELGGWIGSQEVAIKLMGLGGALGLWDVVTPALLGIEGQMAQELLGRGMLLIGPKSDSSLNRWFDGRQKSGDAL